MRLSGRTSSIHTDSHRPHTAHPINPLEDQIEDGLGPASGVFFSQKRSFAALTMVKNILDLIFSFVVFHRGLDRGSDRLAGSRPCTTSLSWVGEMGGVLRKKARPQLRWLTVTSDRIYRQRSPSCSRCIG